MNNLIKLSYLVPLIFFESCTPGHGQNLTLASNGKSAYQITMVPGDNANVKKGAAELQKYFKQATGITLTISQSTTPGDNQIWIGTQKAIKKMYPQWKEKDLEDDGLAIVTFNHNLIIAGGGGKGPLYGVYTFLEKYLGCRMYTSDDVVVPHQSSVTLPSIHLTEIPKLVFRAVFYRPAMSSAYADWHKLTPVGASYASYWGKWSHTSFQYVPPSKYFKTHPEYYSLVGNKRQPDQLDYTDPQAYHVLLGALNAQIKAKPQYQYWSVGQEDNSHYCQCPVCQKVYQQTGSPAGTIVEFVNKIAKFFPHKTISTLAYTYSRKPPSNIALAPNLNIMFCTDIRKYVTDHANSAEDQVMRNQLEGWMKLTHNIFIWDYIVDFSALESIYPNLLKLKPNLDYFVNKGIRGYFAQGDFYQGGEFAELRSYLMAKLLWNPDADDKSIIQDFLQGYYGKAAAPFLWKYIQLTDLQLTGGPNKLSPKEIESYYQLFSQAEAASKGNADFLNRVQKEKIGLDYSAVQYYLKDAQQQPEVFFNNPSNSKQFTASLESFLNGIKKFKTQRLVHTKGQLPLYQYYQNWKTKMNTLKTNYKKR